MKQYFWYGFGFLGILLIVILLGIKLKEKYSPSEEEIVVPHLLNEDRILFEQYLSQIQRYFEFGSGKSTIYALRFPNIQAIRSIENERNWYQQVKQKVQGHSKVELHYVDTNSDNKPWGYPQTKNLEKFRNYFQSYLSEFNADLVMIDGRFRVSCCLDLYPKIRPDTLVFFDDFLNRPHYHHVLEYYDIVVTGKVAVVLKKKPKVDLNRLAHSIQQYEMDPR